MRPESIRKFDWLYLGSLAVSILAFVLDFGRIAAQVDRQMVDAGVEAGSGLVAGSLIFSVVVSLALWFLVSRQRVGIVRWVLAIFFAFGLIGIPGVVALLPGLSAILNLVVLMMQLGAIWFLFQPDARAWFAEKRGGGDS